MIDPPNRLEQRDVSARKTIPLTWYTWSTQELLLFGQTLLVQVCFSNHGSSRRMADLGNGESINISTRHMRIFFPNSSLELLPCSSIVGGSNECTVPGCGPERLPLDRILTVLVNNLMLRRSPVCMLYRVCYHTACKIKRRRCRMGAHAPMEDWPSQAPCRCSSCRV